MNVKFLKYSLFQSKITTNSIAGLKANTQSWVDMITELGYLKEK
jgi:hypothetical protein